MDESPLHDRLTAVVGELSLRQIGQLTNTHPETVRRYMQGQAPSAEFLAILCVKFEINGEWLLTGRGPMRAKDIRVSALGEASAAELLNAMAATIERLIDRVDRLEVFVNTLETRLRGGPSGGDGYGVGGGVGVGGLPPGADSVGTMLIDVTSAQQVGTGSGWGGGVGGSRAGEASAGDAVAARIDAVANAITKPARQGDS